jgi:hypothetical protein
MPERDFPNTTQAARRKRNNASSSGCRASPVAFSTRFPARRLGRALRTIGAEYAAVVAGHWLGDIQLEAQETNQVAPLSLRLANNSLIGSSPTNRKGGARSHLVSPPRSCDESSSAHNREVPTRQPRVGNSGIELDGQVSERAAGVSAWFPRNPEKEGVSEYCGSHSSHAPQLLAGVPRPKRSINDERFRRLSRMKTVA